MNNKSDLYTTLKWLIDLLNQMDIPYQVVGGLAAQCYGSTRPLHDIDFYVPGKDMSKLKNKLTEHINFGPEHYQNEYWDLIFMKLSYNGHQIEIGDADNTWYFDSQSGQWIKEKINFSASDNIKLNDIELPVMPKQDLITYKQRLNRVVDRMDIKEMQRQA